MIDFPRFAMAAVVLVLAGCSGTDPLDAAPAAATTKASSEAMTQTPNPVPASVLERLYAEVAEASGMERDALTLVRAEAVTWNDGALGCPQPNVDYLQMIVSGYWVILRAGREEYDYRIDNNLRHRRCTGATKQAPIRYPPER